MASTSAGAGPPAENLDMIEKSIGVLGRWHVWIIILVFLCKFPIAWHQLSIIFLAPTMHFTCEDNTDKCAKNCSRHIFNRSIFTETIQTQWNLVCDRAVLNDWVQFTTMFGILCGNLACGSLSDKFGRRWLLIFEVIMQGVTGVIAGFSPWIELFFAMKFLSTFATGGTMVTSFVLIMELIGTKWRTTIGILYQLPFIFGHLSLPLVSYLLRDWRYFQIGISAPSAILFSYICLLPESPRWLLTTGQIEKAIKMMENAAKHNRLPVDKVKDNVNIYIQKKAQLKALKAGNFLDLIRTRIMLIYTICVGYNWFVFGLCFYGVAQYIGYLAGNVFVNVAFSAAIQIPGVFVCIWTMNTFGRKISVIVANTIAGISSILIAVVPNDPIWIRITLSCICTFALAFNFSAVYIYSGELFPTVFRNSGVGVSSASARIGSMVAPFITRLNEVGGWIPSIVYGVVPLIGVLLCLLLPETLDCKLPDTVEEAEILNKRKGRKDVIQES